MRTTTLTGLVVMDGMLSPEEWEARTHDQRARWLASLDRMGLRAQASVLAVEREYPVDHILFGWVAEGCLSYTRVVEALEGLPW